MACAYKYMCAFDAVVLPVMAEYSSDITRIFSVLPRMSNLQDEVAFISRSDEFKKNAHTDGCYWVYSQTHS